jgi:hypothetical protein
MIRTYTTKANRNRFSQLLFEETFGLVMVIGFISAIIFLFIPIALFPKLVLIGMTTVILSIISSTKFNNQPLYLLIVQSLQFSSKPRKLTSDTIQNMSDYYYSLQDNYVFTTKQALGVLQIYPRDVSFMSEQQRGDFQQHLAEILHSLKENQLIQIKVISRRAVTIDYKEYLDSLVAETTAKTKGQYVVNLVFEHINSVLHKIENEFVPFKDYYLIIPIYIGSNPKSQLLRDRLVKLRGEIENFQLLLRQNNIRYTRLTSNDLHNFYTTHIDL